MKKTDVPFCFRRGGLNNDPGIWMKCFGRDYLLSPKDLFISLLNEKSEIYMRVNSNHYIGMGVINVSKSNAIDFLFPQDEKPNHKDSVRWAVSEFNTGESVLMLFSNNEYKEAVHRCLENLRDTLEYNNAPNIYNNIDVTSVKAYLNQFDVANYVCRNVYKRFLKDAPEIHELSFTCIHHICDIEYSLKFGDFVLKSCISDWTTTLSLLREQLEQGKCVELFFEDSPTLLKLESLPILKSLENTDTSITFDWENEISLFTITPNAYCKETYVIGLCRKRQVIKALYEGLLAMASRKFVDSDYNETWDDIDSITFYNQIKSPVVEDFICKRMTYMNDTVFRRQQRIDHVITIYPDFDYLYQDEEGLCDGFGEKDTIEIDFDDIKTVKIRIEGFEDWWKEYVVATDFAATTTNPSFDYPTWNKRGLAFAKQLREQLPDNIDLWYKAPYEDAERRDQPAILIYKEYAPIMRCNTRQ